MLLKIVNYLIAAAALALACAVYWFGYRALPQTAGTIASVPIEAPVTIVRDAHGVPHIQARSLDDAFFAQGYAVAQDRLFQLEMGRRLAAGEAAELFGARAVESDLESRRLRMRRLAAMHAAAIPAEDRAAMAALARGINFFIETHAGRLPMEFRLLKTTPAPWTVTDSVLIGLHMYRSMTNNFRDEVTLRNMLAAAGSDAAMIERLFPARTGGEPMLGSNAWALAGRFTKSGKPLLASDPHLGFSLPGIWYQVHIKAPGLDVAGVGLPGLPGVGIGHNREIAWGITNLGFDVQDLYLEGGTMQVRQERDIVRVAGGASVEVTTLVTPHGPVVANAGPTPLALRWAAAEPGKFHFPFVELNRAGNWSEFRRALSRYPGPGFNFLYADREGNIGLQVAGQLPIRTRPGTLPQPPGAAADEWKGMIPFEELPSYYNPPSGVLVSGNQNPFPKDYRYPVNGTFAPPYRARQIEAMLARGKAWEPAGMLRIQRDVYSGFSHFLAGQMAAAFKSRGATNPALTDAVERLAKWNGQMDADSPEALLATLAFQHLRKAVTERAAPGQSAAYQAGMAPAVLEQLLRERPKGWFPDYDQLLVRVLLDAVEEGRRMQGSNIGKWSYGAYSTLLLEQPVMSAVPYLGNLFKYSVNLSGSSNTIKQTSPRVGPSMRFVADLSDWDRSMMNVVAGQSGQALSRHRMDQWKSYWAGESLPMAFEKVDAAETLTLAPR